MAKYNTKSQLVCPEFLCQRVTSSPHLICQLHTATRKSCYNLALSVIMLLTMINTDSSMGELYFTEHMQIIGISWCNQVNLSYLQVSTRKGPSVSHIITKISLPLFKRKKQLSCHVWSKNKRMDPACVFNTSTKTIVISVHSYTSMIMPRFDTRKTQNCYQLLSRS